MHGVWCLPRKDEENELDAMYGTVWVGEGWRMGLILVRGLFLLERGEVTSMREGRGMVWWLFHGVGIVEGIVGV